VNLALRIAWTLSSSTNRAASSRSFVYLLKKSANIDLLLYEGERSNLMEKRADTQLNRESIKSYIKKLYMKS
jgi:hypothetical protein